MSSPATCPFGHPLDEPPARFCPECGAVVACSRGHAVLAPGLSFCETCGELLQPTGEAASAPSRPGRVPLGAIAAGFVAVPVLALAGWLLISAGDDSPSVPTGASSPAAGEPARATRTATSGAAKGSPADASATKAGPTQEVAGAQVTASPASQPTTAPTTGAAQPPPPTATSPPPPTATSPPPATKPADTPSNCLPLNVSLKFSNAADEKPVSYTAAPNASPGCPAGKYTAGTAISIQVTAVAGQKPFWGSSPPGLMSPTSGTSSSLTFPDLPGPLGAYIAVIYYP